MSLDPKTLIDGYLDETISAQQQSQLSDWIKADAENAKSFARAVWLHDQLHNSLAIHSLGTELPETRSQKSTSIWSVSSFATATSWAQRSRGWHPCSVWGCSGLPSGQHRHRQPFVSWIESSSVRCVPRIEPITSF